MTQVYHVDYWTRWEDEQGSGIDAHECVVVAESREEAEEKFKKAHPDYTDFYLYGDTDIIL